MYEAKLYDGGCRARQATTTRHRRASGVVLRDGTRPRCAIKKDARARRPPRTGCVKTHNSNDVEILAGYPKPIQWAAYLLVALAISGVLPMALAAALDMFCDAFNCWWLVFVLFGAELWFIVRMVGR